MKAPLTPAQKQARYRRRQELAPLRAALDLQPITLHLSPPMRAQVAAILRDRITQETSKEKQDLLAEAITGSPEGIKQ